jgi:hypothetical protein
MDCLGRLLDKAQEDMILLQIGPQILRFRSSIYAEDVVISYGDIGKTCRSLLLS